MWTLAMAIGLSVCMASAEPEALVERLVKAVEDGDAATLESLLDDHPRYVGAHSSHQTLLHLAAQRKDPAIARLLLRRGANVHAEGFNGERPLHYAASPEVAGLLLEAGARINAVDGRGWTPLDMALQRRDEVVAEYLLDKGADPEAGRDSLTTLGYALWGVPRLVPRLVERGADVNARGYDGRMPVLHLAVKTMNVPAVEVFLRRGAGIRSRGADGSTVMHMLASTEAELREAPGFEESRLRMARLLLDSGADIHARDGEERTVLHLLAVQPESVRLMRFLIQKKADFRARNRKGRAPLHEAASAGAVPLVALLLDVGARADSLDGEGQTPLHLAIEAMTGWKSVGPVMSGMGELVRVPQPSPRHQEVISLLLKGGADVTRKDKRGRSPLGLAREYGLHAVVEQLSARLPHSR